MKIQRITSLAVMLLLFGPSLFAQFKQLRLDPKSTDKGIPMLSEPVKIPFSKLVKAKNFDPTRNQLSLGSLLNPGIKVIAKSADGMPVAWEGVMKNADQNRYLGMEQKVVLHLKALAPFTENPNLADQFAITRITKDDKGFDHIRLQQSVDGIPVYGGELTMHSNGADIDFVTGRVWPFDVTKSSDPALTQQASLQEVWNDMGGKPVIAMGVWTHLIKDKAALVYYPLNSSDVRLCYHHSVYKTAVERWEYIVDATTGEILKKFPSICKFHNHAQPAVEKENDDILIKYTTECSFEDAALPPLDGPTTATAQDLFNINRTINTYQVGNKFYLIDGARSMFKANSSMPNDPQGVIWTIDAFNTAPQNSDFSADHVTSNNNSWSNKTGVSAHYNGGKAYDYFKNLFGRNSINGSGGNIVSFINIADEDGSSLGNAFWNGAAMFYGNGDSAFQPLARGLDVAGHEMTHGVVQNTANLEYQGESGALNESFADVFGSMIDRDDWLIGEDVVKTAAFPSGALRSLQDPHNGAATNDFNRGWQPKKYSERYKGSEDNGGVHLNSGIPNHAFFLFASNVGKDKAEKVYYKVLDQYLTKSSQFIDCRVAVIRAAREEFGESAANAAAAAFDAVEVFGNSGGEYEDDVNINPGQDLILFTSENQQKLYIYTAQGDVVADPLTNTNPISRPSISDDGSVIVFVATDQKIHYIIIDWTAGSATENVLQTTGTWRNAAISKDGTKLAALRSAEENYIVVFDLLTGAGANFELTNPTFTTGISTGDVLYADAMEWDFTGEYVMYDAKNSVKSNSGFDIEFWDIGFIKVWNNSSKNFALPDQIEKLFPALDEGLSVGNPTFSKNSPYIIAFDYLENDSYYVLGANIETGDVGVVFENTDIGYPSYSRSDDAVILDNATFFGTDLNIVPLESDKITGQNNPIVFAEGYSWGVWFSNGSRQISAISEVNTQKSELGLFPNPARDWLTISYNEKGSKPASFEVYDLLGKKVKSGMWPTSANLQLDVQSMPSGTYIFRCMMDDGRNHAQKFVKR